MDKNKIKNLIQELIEKTGVTEGSVSITEEEPKEIRKKDGKSTIFWFQAEIKEPHFFLARDGEALFALNHIVRKMIEPKIRDTKEAIETREEDEKSVEVVVDIGGYQKKRIENIHALAHMMAERARYFKSSIEIDPMSAFERRIIHEFLADAPDLKTESEGKGAGRRVVIRYTGGI